MANGLRDLVETFDWWWLRIGALTCIFLCFTAVPTSVAQQVEVRIDVPAAAAAYSGRQPVTFGVPFERGRLVYGAPIYVTDEAGKLLPSHCEPAATWSAERKHVKWLHVHTYADIAAGKATKLQLRSGVPGSDVGASLRVTEQDNVVTVRTASSEWRFDAQGGNFGKLILATQDGDLTVSNYKVQCEEQNVARCVVKITGDFVTADNELIGEFITRVRLYPETPLVRVFHTMIWQVDHKTHKLGSLRFERPVSGNAKIGLDGKPTQMQMLRQIDHDKVINEVGKVVGEKLSGYIHLQDESIHLRWPWQQYPTGFALRGGKAVVGLIDPVEPLSLDELSVAAQPNQRHRWAIWVPGVGKDNPRINGFPVGELSPRGVSRTYEMVIWPNDEHSVEIRNALVQQPTYAFADPSQMTRIDQPLPMSPRDDENFGEIESAISRNFDWIALEHAPHHDFGMWDFGDVQWNWSGYGFNSYRLWMNNGKGWSIVPWVLYMRSGERKYREHGERNGRHVMDVDTCHVRHWAREGYDAKMRGTPYHYSGIHWAHGPHPATFFVDSEYLPYYYFLTGYERAHDVLLERVESLKHWNYPDWESDWWKNAEACSRYQYSTLRDLAVLYEATWDPGLLKPLQTYYEFVLRAQHDTGYFPGITSPFYLDQALHIASRALGDERGLAALEKWAELKGMYGRDGFEGRQAGHDSHWTYAAVHRKTGDTQLLDYAERTMNAAAQVVAKGNSIYNGLDTQGAHTIGPSLRGWVATMAELKRAGAKPDPGKLYPMTHFHGRLPVTAEQQEAGWQGRHVILVLDQADDAFDVRIWAHTGGAIKPTPIHVRRFDPDGSLTASVTEHLQATYKTTFGKSCFSIGVPKDEKQGVYAFEIWSKDMARNVMAISSTGKLVHYLPKGNRIFGPLQYGGQCWFEPSGQGEVFVGYPAKGASVGWGRNIAYDPAGNVIAESRIDTVNEQGQPGIDHPLRFVPQAEGLHSMLIAGGHFSERWVRELKGMRPWFSSTRDQWFDPQRYACPDLSMFTSVAVDALKDVHVE